MSTGNIQINHPPKAIRRSTRPGRYEMLLTEWCRRKGLHDFPEELSIADISEILGMKLESIRRILKREAVPAFWSTKHARSRKLYKTSTFLEWATKYQVLSIPQPPKSGVRPAMWGGYQGVSQ